MKGYKILTKDMYSPFDKKTKWILGKSIKLENNQELKIGHYGLHLYKSLDNVSIGAFGSRVFEAETIDDYIEDANKLCSYEVKLLKELKPSDVTDSYWSYLYCKNIHDNIEVAKNITNSLYAFYYSIEVRDKEINNHKKK